MPSVIVTALDASNEPIENAKVSLYPYQANAREPVYANGSIVKPAVMHTAVASEEPGAPDAGTATFEDVVASADLNPVDTPYWCEIDPPGRERAKRSLILVPDGVGPYEAHLILADPPGELESAALSLHRETVKDHEDWSDTPPTSGQVPFWNGTAWVPGDTHATDLEVTSAINTHNADITAVHGIADTSLLETQAGATAKVAAEATARAADVDAEAAARVAADAAVASAAASALTTHEADTTNVHGITDTTKLIKWTTDDGTDVTLERSSSALLVKVGGVTILQLTGSSVIVNKTLYIANTASTEQRFTGDTQTDIKTEAASYIITIDEDADAALDTVSFEIRTGAGDTLCRMHGLIGGTTRVTQWGEDSDTPLTVQHKAADAVTNALGSAYETKPGESAGTDKAGAVNKVHGGSPTGAGVGGSVELWTAPPGGSGTTVRATAKRLEVDGYGSAWLNNLYLLSQQADKPTAALLQSNAREENQFNQSILTSGRLHLRRFWFPAGLTITSITFQSGATAFTPGTDAGTAHYWFAIYDVATRALIRATADAGNAAWAASSEKTLNLTSTWTPLTSGYYYVGIMVAQGTGGSPAVPSLVGKGSTSSGAMWLLAPAHNGTSNTGLGATPPDPANALAANNLMPWCYVS